ncbi:MAG TPA: HD domain-containing phosphohydrolase [Gemmatimonadota bacterium]|nr:HD domain-containing phosphohydrolase [Gemmatimonadota bacterium]
MTAFDRQELTSSGGPTGDLRVRVTGLGEWGIRIAELLDGDGVTSRAIDTGIGVLRSSVDPGRRHRLEVESRIAGRWAAISRALSTDPELQAGLASDADADLMVLAADVSTGAGAMLATLVKRLVKAAPGVGRLAIARLPESRSEPDRRARALVAVNALLEGPPCAILLVQPPSDSALDPGDPRAVVSRIRELVALVGEERGVALRGLEPAPLARLLSTPGFLAWREMDLEADDCARDAPGWHDRFQEPVSWQPSGFEWSAAQAVLPLARAPRAWIEGGGKAHFERLVRDVWEEAGPCELQPALYEGEPAMGWLISAGMAFPRGVLAMRDSVLEDRARLAEKQRAATVPIPLGEGFLDSAEEIAPSRAAESPAAVEGDSSGEELTEVPAAETREVEMGGGAEPAAEPVVSEGSALAAAGEPALEAAGEPEVPPPASRESEPAPARAPAEAIYHTALGLARRIFRARDLQAEIDLGQVRYALYDLLERLRADPGSLMAETFRATPEDWFERHHVNVAILALLTADTRRGALSDVIDLGTVAFLHDIGMLEARETWDVAMRLPPKTFERVIRPHADAGFRMVQQVPGVTPSMARIVLQEHERMDGTGYPAGLVGEGIDADARLLAVCDTLEALSHPRPYREGLPPRDALTRIRVLGRYTLDGDIVDTLASELDVLLEGEVLSSRSA